MLKSRFLGHLLFLSLGVAIIPAVFNVLYIYPSFSKLLMENTEDEAIRTSNHLISSLHLEQSKFSKDSFDRDFTKEVEAAKKDTLLIKIKVFSKTGEVLFSTESKDVGVMNKRSYFHDIVAKGHIYTKVVLKKKKTLEDQQLDVDVVETYVPIMKEGQFVGAFEIYYDITAKTNKINRLLWGSWLALFVMSMLLVVGFAWSIWRLDIHITHRKITEAELMKRNKQMQDELNLAGEFQQRILPKIHNLSYLRISSKYLPYAEVSGDTYGFSISREGTTNFFLGDATGHGISAAFMTMMLQIALDNIKYNLSTDDAIREINTSLVSHETEKFITGVYLRITPEGLLRASNAAHPPLIIIPADKTELVFLERGGSIIGVFSDDIVPYVEEKYQLQPNDRIFTYTDGLIEWMNKDGEQFGIERLINFLNKHRIADADIILNELLEHLFDFSQGNKCGDDLTMFIFHYIGKND